MCVLMAASKFRGCIPRRQNLSAAYVTVLHWRLPKFEAFTDVAYKYVHLFFFYQI